MLRPFPTRRSSAVSETSGQIQAIKNETNASGVGISRCEVMPRTLPGSIYKFQVLPAQGKASRLHCATLHRFELRQPLGRCNGASTSQVPPLAPLTSLEWSATRRMQIRILPVQLPSVRSRLHALMIIGTLCRSN